MKVEKKKQNRDIKEQFITSILKMYHYFELNHSFTNFIYFLGLLQPLLFQNLYSTTPQTPNEQILTPINQFWYVEVISRPDILITNNIANFGYLISLFTCLIFVFAPLLLNILSKISKNLKSKLTFYLSLTSIFFQLLPLYFQIPLQSLCFKSLYLNLIENQIPEFSYINIVLSLFTSIMLFVFNFFILILCKESIDFQLNCFLTLQLNFIDFVIWNLSILQIIVYYFLSEINEIMQAIILLVYSILLLVNIFSLNTCLKKIIVVTLFTASYGLVQSVLILINCQIDISIKVNILLYIQVPLCCYIILQLFYRLDFKVSGNITQLSIRNNKYIFAKFFNDEFISSTQKIIMYTNIILLYSKKKSIEPQASLPLACINQEFMPRYLMSYFYKYQLKTYLKQLQRPDLKYRNANNYIHYASILYKLGQNNLSLKQINILLFNINLYTHSNSRSFAKENQNEQVKSLNTMIQGGKSSVSRSSKSQEVLEAGHHQINKTNKMLAAPGNHFLTFAQKVRIIILREKVKDKLKLTFQYREIAADTFNLQNAIEMFLKSERRNQSLKDHVFNLVNSKLQFYQQLQSVKHIRSTQLFEVAKQLSYKQINLENKLIKLYKYFPSQRIQSLCTYYFGELIGNYLDAHKLTCNSSIADEKLLNVHNNQIEKYTFFNKDLVYLNVRLIEDTQELEIVNMNQQSCAFFQRNFEDFKINSTIDSLLPNGIINEHSLLVQRFLQNSESRFYLKKNLNFYKLHGEIIRCCEFFFDVDFSDNSQIQFLVFMNESYETSAFMIVDVNLQLGGFTRNFLDKLGYTDYYIENIKSKYLTNAPIELIFPEFTDLVGKKSFLNATELKFLKQQVLVSNFIDDTQRNTKHDFSEWQNPSNILFCEGLIQIHSRDLFGFQYFIIEIKEIKTDLTQKGFHDESNSLDRAFSSQSYQEAVANSPCALQIEKQKFEAFSRNIFELKMDQDKSQSFYHPQYELNIMSPVDMSMTPAPLNSANPLLKMKQQEYFSYLGQNLEGANSFSSKNQALAIDLEDIEQVAQVKQPKEGDDTNSSQYAGAKKSQFYKKYEMCQLITRRFVPPQLKIFIALLIVQFIVCSVHYILIVSKNQKDLDQFISEIDMIELHSSFMAPHDIFVAMRIAIISYNSYVNEGAITAAQAVILNKPFYDNIAIGYTEIKEVFIKQLTNQNLQPFFENKTIGMVFMDFNVSDVYNNTLNIREALQQIIQNLFQYKYRYENRMSTANSSIQVFGVANQFFLHYWLENLTLEILGYSKHRSVLISSDWTILWVIFLVLSLSLISGVLHYYRMYNQKYDKYLGVFKFCNQNKLSFEIDRYKQIQKSLQKNSDQIFQYKFDLIQKESQLLTQAKIQDAINKRNKDQQKNLQLQYESLSIILGVSLLFGVWAIFLGLSVIIFQGEIGYLDKYSDTVDIYKLIQDMTFSSATLYQNRDYHFIFKNFTYLTQFDEDYMFFLIDSGISNIEKFNVLCQTFDPSKYQVNDDFVNFFNIIQKNSVCDSLGTEVMGFLTDFCDISIQGNFLNGVNAALNFIKNQVQTQMVVNKFTTRIEHPFYDNEAGIIMVRVFQLMTQKLKTSMLGVTNDLQTISVVLSAIYLIFAAISIIIIFFGFRKYLEEEYNIVKRFIQLLPPSVILLEDQFERYIRILLIDEIE